MKIFIKYREKVFIFNTGFLLQVEDSAADICCRIH